MYISTYVCNILCMYVCMYVCTDLYMLCMYSNEHVLYDLSSRGVAVQLDSTQVFSHSITSEFMRHSMSMQDYIIHLLSTVSLCWPQHQIMLSPQSTFLQDERATVAHIYLNVLCYTTLISAKVDICIAAYDLHKSPWIYYNILSNKHQVNELHIQPLMIFVVNALQFGSIPTSV